VTAPQADRVVADRYMLRARRLAAARAQSGVLGGRGKQEDVVPDARSGGRARIRDQIATMGLTEAAYGLLVATLAAGSLIGASWPTPSFYAWAARGRCS
jgi:hypothetical protein